MSYVFFSSSLPGVPVWHTPPEVLQEVLLESLNFFYVNSGLNALGLSPIPDIPVRCPCLTCAHFWSTHGQNIRVFP